MKSACSLFLLLPFLPLVSPAAQVPDLQVTPAARPGERVDGVLTGRPHQPFVTLLDIHGGPFRLIDQILYLGLRHTVVVDSGSLGFAGFRTFGLPVPTSAPTGEPLYFQSLLLTANNQLEATDGESTVLFASRGLIVQDYRDPSAEGLTGTYDRNVKGRLQAAGPRMRVHDVVPNQGVAFGIPVWGPLNPYGVRQQSVYRAADVGATGEPEVLTAVRWKPLGPLSVDAIGLIEINVSHTRVTPDYSVDPWSALPRYPTSGLDATFLSNVKPGETMQQVYSGGYVINPALQRRDGYMPYPDLQNPFHYNGFDSLLFDFAVPPNTSTGANGQQVWLMVQSSPLPAARVQTAGSPGRLVTSPRSLTRAEREECVWHEIQLEFANLQSTAVSGWIAAPFANPRYGTPYVSASVAGGSFQLAFRGATYANGSNPTPWVVDVGVVSGAPFVQYRVQFQVGLRDDLRPSIDQIVIPVF